MSPSAPSPHSSNGEHPNDPFDYSFVNTTARIAVYDDLRSAPRILLKSSRLKQEYLSKTLRQVSTIKLVR